MTLRRLAAAALAVLALLTLSACSKSLDTEKLEAEIASGIEQQLEVDEVTVDCPGERDAKAGDTFTCTVETADGERGEVTVTQKDDDGNVEWELTRVDD